jgi:hypothetical protein
MGGAGEKNIFNHGESLLWNRSDTAIVAVLMRIPMKADTHSDSYRTLIRRYRTVVGAKRRSAVSNKELSDMRQENRA